MLRQYDLHLRHLLRARWTRRRRQSHRLRRSAQCAEVTLEPARYHQQQYLAEIIVPELEAALADEALPKDLESRFAAAFTTIWSSNSIHEAAYRTILRRGLERPPGESIEHEEEAGSIRAGRRVRWLRNALEPAREWMDEEGFERLVAGMCLCIGIESLVVLRDVCDLKAKEAEEVARWAAFTLLRASFGEGESPDGGYPGHRQDVL